MGNSFDKLVLVLLLALVLVLLEVWGCEREEDECAWAGGIGMGR